MSRAHRRVGRGDDGHEVPPVARIELWNSVSTYRV